MKFKVGERVYAKDVDCLGMTVVKCPLPGEFLTYEVRDSESEILPYSEEALLSAAEHSNLQIILD